MAKAPIVPFSDVHSLFLQRPDKIHLEHFRGVIRTCHDISANPSRYAYNPEKNEEDINSVMKMHDLLYSHLKSGFTKTDAQFLCATTFCCIISILPSQHKKKKLENVYKILRDYLLSRHSDDKSHQNDDEAHNLDKEVVLLIHGLFHSNLVFMRDKNLGKLCDHLLQLSIEVSIDTAMGYSNNTLTAFRNLNTILGKVIQVKMQSKISGDTCNTLLYVIFNNWENPFTGVREQNSKILNSLLNILADSVEKFLECVMIFPWNKAKYFTLSELVPTLKSKDINYPAFYDSCIQGLKFSLKNQSLVSAGSFLFKSLMQKFDHYDAWENLFGETMNEILISQEMAPKRNLLNYWLPIAVKKFPEYLLAVLKIFMGQRLEDHILYPFLHAIKIGRKAGHILQTWKKECKENYIYKNALIAGVNNISEEIRSEAFEAICSHSKTTNIPTPEEIQIVKDFLQNNINYDSPAFRRNLTGSFTRFFIVLRDSFLNTHLSHEKINKDETHGRYRIEFEAFFIWLYQFVIENLHKSGNYQRKILTLQIFDLVLRFLYGGIFEREMTMKVLGKGAQRCQGLKIVDYLQSRNIWKFDNNEMVSALLKCTNDSTDDIKEVSVYILIQYYLTNDNLLKRKNDLFIHGMILCNNFLFYEVESGCNTFKLLSKLHNRSKITNFSALENEDGGETEIHQYLTDRAWQQFRFHNEDILYSIYNNQPLHGLLSALNVYIGNTEYNIPVVDLKSIIQLIHEVTKFLLDTLAIKTSDKQYPPSFAEMDESVDSIILSSKYEIENEDDESPHFSNVRQVVTNIIWLNLKACCELATTLITTFDKRFTNADVKKCLDIKISVLTRCRHKGAIESAGVNLGSSVKHLTTANRQAYKEMLLDILRKFLLEVTCENIMGGSVTRRSAGLTILVHRMVTNDSLEGKPLFYNAMKILLNTLNFNEPNKELVPPKGSITPGILKKYIWEIKRGQVVKDKPSSCKKARAIEEALDIELGNDASTSSSSKMNVNLNENIFGHRSNRSSPAGNIAGCISRKKREKTFKNTFIQNTSAIDIREQPGSSESDDNDFDSLSNERDIPQATALHLLCRTVNESSLTNYVLQFASQLFTTCFMHFQSEQWQVRNAALQLYGALIPKLVGQKKKQGTNEFVESPMSPDELLSHLPVLWDYIKDVLKYTCTQKDSRKDLSNHSNLVPILSLLSSMAKRIPLNQFKLTFHSHFKRETFNKTVFVANIEIFFPYLTKLLSSPIYTVRDLTAKIVESFFDTDVFYKYWKSGNYKSMNENNLHGHMLVLKYHIKSYKYIKDYMPNNYNDTALIEYEDMLSEMGKFVSAKFTSFVLKATYLEILYDLTNNTKSDHTKIILNAFDTMETYKDNANSQIGIYHWLYVTIYSTIIFCNESCLVNIVNFCIKKSDEVPSMDSLLPALKKRLKESFPRHHLVSKHLAEAIVSINFEKKKYLHKYIFEILYTLASNSSGKTVSAYSDQIMRKLVALNDIDDNAPYNNGHLLPLICLLYLIRFNRFPNLDVTNDMLELSKIVKILSNFDIYDSEVRLYSAMSIKYLMEILTSKSCKIAEKQDMYEIKFDVFTSLFWLLQDEDANVRFECSHVILFDEKKPTHPNRHLRTILSQTFFIKYLTHRDLIIKFLTDLLVEIAQRKKEKSEDFEGFVNPFDNQTNNIYFESDMMIRKLTDLLLYFKHPPEGVNLQ